jgi:hypothetical protein
VAVTFSRYTDSQLRLLLSVLGADVETPLDEIAARLERLRRGLEPEDEISLILSWLGQCRLVHKLGQEQLPIDSAGAYRVPDLLAVFDVDGEALPVLIEVKKRHSRDPATLQEGRLSLHARYIRYAELVGLSLLVAWKHRTFWTLFDSTVAAQPDGQYRIGFFEAMKQNLLGILAGDFSYRVAPGTAIRMRIEKLSKTDDKGRIRGVIQDTHFVNADGERLPDLPELRRLGSLFVFWENEVEQVDQNDAIIQSFVIPDLEYGEFASRTLGKLLQSFAALPGRDVNLREVIHDREHWVHNSGELRRMVDVGARYGAFTDVFRQVPQELPAFLQRP